jgi:hypothetical protein
VWRGWRDVDKLSTLCVTSIGEGCGKQKEESEKEREHQDVDVPFKSYAHIERSYAH